MFPFLNMHGQYTYFCAECFKTVLLEQGYGDMEFERASDGTRITIQTMTQRDLRAIVEIADIRRTNEIFSNPEQTQAALDTFLEKNPKFNDLLKRNDKKKEE